MVIAIIGILSSVVLASLNTARGRGNDAKVKAQLAGLRAAAELFYLRTGDTCYTGLCTAGEPMASYLLQTNYPTGATVACLSDADSYSVTALLPGLVVPLVLNGVLIRLEFQNKSLVPELLMVVLHRNHSIKFV